MSVQSDFRSRELFEPPSFPGYLLGHLWNQNDGVGLLFDPIVQLCVTCDHVWKFKRCGMNDESDSPFIRHIDVIAGLEGDGHIGNCGFTRNGRFGTDD